MTLSRKRWLATAIILVLAADWLTKFWAQNHLQPFGSWRVLDGWVTFRYAFNPGIAFSFLRDVPAGVRMPLLVTLALVGLVATVSIIRGSRDGWLRLAGALVLGGALGNLGDRLLHGGVTDFIHVSFFPWIFNVADVAISVGGVLLLARMLREPPDAAAEATHA